MIMAGIVLNKEMEQSKRKEHGSNGPHLFAFEQSNVHFFLRPLTHTINPKNTLLQRISTHSIGSPTHQGRSSSTSSLITRPSFIYWSNNRFFPLIYEAKPHPIISRPYLLHHILLNRIR